MRAGTRIHCRLLPVTSTGRDSTAPFFTADCTTMAYAEQWVASGKDYGVPLLPGGRAPGALGVVPTGWPRAGTAVSRLGAGYFESRNRLELCFRALDRSSPHQDPG